MLLAGIERRKGAGEFILDEVWPVPSVSRQRPHRALHSNEIKRMSRPRVEMR